MRLRCGAFTAVSGRFGIGVALAGLVTQHYDAALLMQVDLNDMLRVVRRERWQAPARYDLLRWEPHEYRRSGVYKKLISRTNPANLRLNLEALHLPPSEMKLFDEFVGPFQD